VRFVQSKIDVPVVLPSPLPPGAHLARRPVYVSTFDAGVSAMLHLEFGSREHLYLQYGVATYDGCGADSAKTTTVLGRPAMYNSSRQALWTELIWPATPKHPEGRYGLTGNVTLRQARAMADSMERARVHALHTTMGC